MGRSGDSQRSGAGGMHRCSSSAKAGIFFPVARIRRFLRQGRYAKHIRVGASVYMAAVLEYLAAEVLDIAGNVAHDHNKKRIKPRHIQLGIKNDAEMAELLKKVTIAEGGVLPHIAPELLIKPGAKKSDGKGKAKAKGKGKADGVEDEYAGVPGGLGPGLKQEGEGSSSDDGDYMAADGQQEENDTSSSSDDESAAGGNGGQQ